MSLHDIQTSVHVAKDKTNSFGGYNYRTAEGILAALKSALPSGATVIVSDEMQEVAGQIFVSATATITLSGGETYSAKGHAMHALTKKGMDDAQITGSASSYARKYALSGLLALDDGSADPDSKDHSTSTKADALSEPPQRTARQVADAMIAAMQGVQTYRQWEAITGDPKFIADLAKLEEKAAPMAGEVKKSRGDAKLRVDPASQAA